MFTGRAREDDVVRGVVEAGVETFVTVDHPLVAVRDCRRLEIGRVGAVIRLRQPEREPAGSVQESGHPLGPLLVGSEVAHHQHGREVADDRALVLQVVVQPEAAGGEMLTNDGHLEVGRVVAAVLRGERVPKPTRSVGPAPHLGEQLFPLRARNATRFEVGARVLATVIEEPDVVVLLFEGNDLTVDEIVECVQCRLDLGRGLEVHATPLCCGSTRTATPYAGIGESWYEGAARAYRCAVRRPGGASVFGRNRRAEGEALNEMRAEMIAAAGDRAKLASVLQKLEATLQSDLTRAAREQSTTNVAVENLRQSVNANNTDLADAMKQVATMCALLAERVEAERLERRELIETLVALKTMPVAEISSNGNGTAELANGTGDTSNGSADAAIGLRKHRVLGGSVFTERTDTTPADAVEADVVIIDDPPAAEPAADIPKLVVGNVVRCRFGDQWIDDLEVCEIVDDWKPVRYRLRRTVDNYVLPARFTRGDIEFVAASVEAANPRRRWNRS